MLSSSLAAACGTLSHVETMSLVKGPRPAGVPSLFLPANKNERRILHSVSSHPLLTGRESTTPQEKVLLQCYDMHV